MEQGAAQKLLPRQSEASMRFGSPGNRHARIAAECAAAAYPVAFLEEQRPPGSGT